MDKKGTAGDSWEGLLSGRGGPKQEGHRLGVTVKEAVLRPGRDVTHRVDR